MSVELCFDTSVFFSMGEFHDGTILDILCEIEVSAEFLLEQFSDYKYYFVFLNKVSRQI